ncbi:MAG: hypothetical protein ACREUY_03865, partial [Burkholderiales bacterium]
MPRPNQPIEIDTPAQLIAEPQEAVPDEIALDRVLNELESGEVTAKVSIWRANRQTHGGGKVKDEFLQTLS